MAVAYVIDEVFAGHVPPGRHPERPERFAAARDALKQAGLADRGLPLPVREAAGEEIGRVHTAAYWAELEAALPGRAGWLDPDTFYSPGTWRATLAAAGAAVDLAGALLDGRATTGLAIVRPPGHHAEADRGMGFCLVNNVAVAAAAARAAGVARVAVVDWDVHHGNGTQAIFWRDPAVLYASIHQWPFYPGTGAVDEIGEGPGRGTTVNVPLPAGSGDAEWLAAIDQVVVPALDRFRPELVLVSAGFDAFRGDPLASMELSAEAYGAMTGRLLAVAARHAGGRLGLVLEGGYDLDGLGRSVAASYLALERGAPAGPPEATLPAVAAASAIGRSRRALGLEAAPEVDR
jgi:acetoin utilization deacetylase AcuC-like enzyme